MKNSPVSILYFSDVLCIWAYIAQRRMDEVKNNFANKVDISEHFVPVFGSVNKKMKENWDHRGGIKAYNQHVLEVANQFPHVDVHSDVWLKQTPTSSASCHYFVKAVQLLVENDETSPNKNTINDYLWHLRTAFFSELRDISNIKVQMEIAESLHLSRDKIEKLMASGEVFAALDNDRQLKEKYNIQGSPSLVLNDGRQILYGNVGYKIIEANIESLINVPSSQASWC